jgi:pilus assembly protein CpaE
MAVNLRICLFDKAAASNAALRQIFEELDDVTIVGHCAEWNVLQQHLQCGGLNAVAVNLDGGAEQPRFLTVQRVSEVAPDCAIIGISTDTSPDFIIAAMRAGCSQFVRAPIDPQDLAAALERIRKRHLPVAEGCQQIAVLGAHGGAGSTTLACNLALELAHVTGRRMGLVDLDLQFGDIACAFDRAPKYSIADLCRAGVEIDRTLLETALDALPSNVSILARPENLEDSEQIQPDAVEQMLRGLAQMFPFVVVDVPRVFTAVTLGALNLSSRIFIVSQLAVPFLRNATRVYHSLLHAGIAEENIEFVLNRCNADHERIKPADVEKHFGRAVFAVIPNDYKHVTASRDLGHPIQASAPNSPARLAIRNLARRLATAHLGEEALQSERRGLLGLFRRKSGKKATVGR